MTEIIRRTWAEIDLDALANNYRIVRGSTDPRAMVCCVVKADCYGHGALRTAAELQSLGADWFAVSNLEEALQLRRGGIVRPVLVLGFTPPEEAGALAKGDISQCVYSMDYGEKLSLCAAAMGVKVKAHLKIDTGMSRLGFYFQDIFRDEGAIGEVIKACSLPGLLPEGVFSHFAVSDEGEEGDAFTMRQFGCFKELSEALVRAGIGSGQPLLRHCANSAAVFDYPLSHLDMVRAGVVLYGLYPSAKLRARPELRPVLALRSVVSHVKTVQPGATISYGRKFTAEREMRVATVPVGYADGYPRALGTGGAAVLIRGRRCPVLGRICMDQLMADVTELPEASMGDRVTLIGRDGGEEISAGEVAGWEDTISYEVVCALSKRVPRVYLKDGRVESIYNQLLSE